MSSTPQSQATEQMQITVPLIDLKLQYQQYKDEALRAVEQVLESQYMINGPAVKELECAIAGYCDCADAVGVSSGSDAILAALMALGVGQGDEVITAPFTFFATAGAIARLGARPIFVDIDPQTYNLDASKVGDAITPRTKVILPVHLFGQMAEMAPLMDLAEKHGVDVVEDAAQSIGAKQDGKLAGSIGHLGCFSFFPTKNLGAAGDGGIITTQDSALADRLRVLRNHGMKPKYFNSMLGGNFRLDTIQAAYLLTKLPLLEGWHEQRRNNAAKYDEAFADFEPVGTPTILEGNLSIYNQYVIRVDQRDALRDHLKAQNVGTEIYYPKCLHEQECFAYLGYERGAFPHAEKAADEVLALPIFAELTDAQIDHVIAQVKAFYR